MTENSDTTEPTTEPEAATEPVAEPMAEEESSEPETADGQLAKARKEAASYRQRLRETESNRDQLTTTVEGLRKQIIEGQAVAAGLKPAALWSVATVADLLTDDGTVDPARVSAAIETTRSELGISRFPGAADQGARSPAAEPDKPGWDSLLRQKH